MSLTISRSEEDRESDPDRLNLDKRGLKSCPIIENEPQLRLINLQQNDIREIQHMVGFRGLVFLDLFDNSIQNISGLESVPFLRVLLLGKNCIRHIGGLDALQYLDVLDLHSNMITAIENLDKLEQLRVLNLAGNQIKDICGVSHLARLEDLNLRQNKISSCSCITKNMISLHRLNLAQNAIKNTFDVYNLRTLRNLNELTFVGNQICKQSQHRDFWISELLALRILDAKRVTEEDKRQSILRIRKEEDKRREAERTHKLQQEKEGRIAAAAVQWRKRFNSTKTSEDPNGEGLPPNYVGIENETLFIYGDLSDVFERAWMSSVSRIHFQYVEFDEIEANIEKIRKRFHSILSLNFVDTGISRLEHINCLSCFKKLEHLSIDEAEPLVRNNRLWQPYAVFRLRSPDNVLLKTINGVDISVAALNQARAQFAELETLTDTLETLAPNSRVHIAVSSPKICNKSRTVEKPQDVVQSHSARSARHRIARSQSAMNIGSSESKRSETRARSGRVTSRHGSQGTYQVRTEKSEHVSLAKAFLSVALNTAIDEKRKRTDFNQVWPCVLKNIALTVYDDYG
eukprot:m.149157 g.149157  ORF g.149157 m.149157 type:complete len:573 (+) comp15007_c2_seq2:180-1898(+)